MDAFDLAKILTSVDNRPPLCSVHFPLNPSYPQNYPRDVISWERIIKTDKLRCSSKEGGKERYFELVEGRLMREVNAYILYDLLSNPDKIRYESHSYETLIRGPSANCTPIYGFQYF